MADLLALGGDAKTSSGSLLERVPFVLARFAFVTGAVMAYSAHALTSVSRR